MYQEFEIHVKSSCDSGLSFLNSKRTVMLWVLCFNVICKGPSKNNLQIRDSCGSIERLLALVYPVPKTSIDVDLEHSSNKNNY